MKVFLLLIVAIYFVVVSNGMPNPLETMIAQDRGYVGCTLKTGVDCSGPNMKGSGCCAPGLSCTKKKPCGYGQKCSGRNVCETAKKDAGCSCLDFMSGDYGNCKTEYWGKKICYTDGKICSDSQYSKSSEKYFSWVACT